MDYETDDLHHALGEHYQPAGLDDGPAALEHNDTILAHQEDATRPINMALVHGHDVDKYFAGDDPANEAHREYHHALHAAIDDLVHNSVSGGAPHHFKVYSGVSPSHGEKLVKANPHDTVHFPAWTSTSLEKNVAHGFSGSSNHVAVFNIRPGFKQGAYIGHIHQIWADEREFLLKPGTRWRKVGQHSQRQEPVVGSSHPGRLITYHHFEPVDE